MEHSPESRFFSTSSGELHVLYWGNAGNSAPLLHFAHANGLNAWTYRSMLGPLSESCRVVAMDFRGHGQSRAEADPRKLKSWGTYRNDLISLLESYGEPAFLAGHSMGGVVSLELAALRPDLVKGLVLLDPVIFPLNFLRFWGAMRILGLGLHIPIAKRAAKRKPVWTDREEIFVNYRKRKIFKPWPDEWLRDYIEGGTHTTSDGRIALSCTPPWEAKSFATLSYKTWRRLRLVQCPITLMHGGRSDTFLPAAAQRFPRVATHSRVVRLEEAGHFLPMEAPDQVREEIVRMMAETGS